MPNDTPHISFTDQLQRMSDAELGSLWDKNAASWASRRNGTLPHVSYRKRKHSLLTDSEFDALAAEYGRRVQPQDAQSQADQTEYQRERREREALRARIRATSDAELARLDSTASTAVELTLVRKEIARRANRAQANPLSVMTCEQLLGWDPTSSTEQVADVVREIDRRRSALVRKRRDLLLDGNRSSVMRRMLVNDDDGGES